MAVRAGYKQTEVGVIPEDWGSLTLIDMVKDNSPICYGIVQVGPNTPNGIPVLAIKNLNSDYSENIHKSSFEIEAPYSRSRVKPDDVLISIKGTVGCIGIAPNSFHGNISRDIDRLRFSGSHSASYCYQVLKSSYIQRIIKNMSVGTTRMELSIHILKNLALPIPPTKAEQEAIAEALSDADGLIESLEQLIAKKQLLKQGAMQELLTPKEGWKTASIGDVASPNQQWSFVGGPFGSNLKSADYTSEGVRVIQLQNIGDGKFKNDYKIYTSVRKADELLTNNIYPGDIILSKMGDPVARACIIPDHHERYLMCSDGIRLSVDQSRFNIYFIYKLINGRDFRTKASNAGTGSTRKRIGLSELRELELSYPALEQQEAIASILSDMDAEIEQLEHKLSKARKMKQGMMQELLTGRIRLV